MIKSKVKRKGMRITALLLAGCLLFAYPATAHADIGSEEADSGEISIAPYNLYTLMIASGLSISSSGVASISVNVVAYSSATKMNTYVYLQRSQDQSTWLNIANWSATTTSTVQNISKTYSVSKGYYYRVVISQYTYSGSKYENIVSVTASKYY